MAAIRAVTRHATALAAISLLAPSVAADVRGGATASPAPSPSRVPSPTQAPAPPGPWQLSWGDEFDRDGPPDPARWVHDLGGNGWGNNELETYTDRPENAVVRGGSLVITALREAFRGADGTERPYTSARLKTLGTFSQAYGRIEARMKIPRGQGIWPAFWMLGNSVATAGWPACGEIDIMENIGKEPNTVHGTLHGPGYSGGQGIGAPYSAASPFADAFHVFGIEWEPNVIRWYVDGALYQTRTPADLPAGARWVFDAPAFIILNLAVGGNWPGDPDATSTFPQELVVDYVRVYKRSR